MSKTGSTQEQQAAEMTAALRASKKELRKTITKTLSGVSQEAVYDQSNRISSRLLNMEEYQNARRISVYLSMDGKEVQTRHIVEDALKRGKKVFVPYLYKRESDGSKLMDMLALKDSNDYQNLARDNWGIPSLSLESVPGRENSFGGLGVSTELKEQDSQAQSSGLDLIVMPGVAFDQRLGRLGHGRGYYDTFIARSKEKLEKQSREEGGKMPLLGWGVVGLALREQLLPAGDSVPCSPFDWPVDRVLTDQAQLPC